MFYHPRSRCYANFRSRAFLSLTYSLLGYWVARFPMTLLYIRLTVPSREKRDLYMVLSLIKRERRRQPSLQKQTLTNCLSPVRRV